MAAAAAMSAPDTGEATETGEVTDMGEATKTAAATATAALETLGVRSMENKKFLPHAHKQAKIYLLDCSNESI